MGREFFFLCALIFGAHSFSANADVIVFSDIDDTIKKANSMGRAAQVYHFLKKKPYLRMRDIYREIQEKYLKEGEKVHFVYVSAAYNFIFPSAYQWMAKHRFPLGKIILRNLHSGKTYPYKYSAIKNQLSLFIHGLDKKNLKAYFFGDNSSMDPKVYHDIKKEFPTLRSQIYIRDVSTEASAMDKELPIKKLEGVHYFFSEQQLIKTPQWNFLSSILREKVRSDYVSNTLVPKYTKKYYRRRWVKHRKCRKLWFNLWAYARCYKKAKQKAMTSWKKYYSDQI